MPKHRLPPQQPPIQPLVNLLQTGQFDLLARQAAECTGRWPASGPLWHLLGLAHLNAGRPGEAVMPLTRASKLSPQDASLLEQLAVALMQAGRQPEAYRAFERCLAMVPNQLGLLINLAHLANDLGKYVAAESHCRAALALAPTQAEALYNLGRALRGLGCQAEAVAAFRATLARAGDSAIAQNDVGLQLQALGASGDAEACFRRAIALAPAYAPAHSNLGRMLEAQGRSEEALAAFRQAIALEPRLPAVHANIGSLYNSLRQFAEAESACRQAIALDPRLAAGFCNLGNALFGQRRYDEAEASYRQALKIDADFADANNNFGNLLQERQRYLEAVSCYRRIRDDDGSALGNAYHCSAHLCDWSRRERDEAALRQKLGDDSNAIGPFGLLTIAGEGSAALQRRAGWLYASKHFRAALESPPLVAGDSHPRRERLRIGYLSADIHEHATMHLLGGVLAGHDRSKFSIHLYSYGPDCQDEARQQALAAAEVFRDFGSLSDEAAARQIAADGIDILVDLKGYTQDSRLAITALRPAPVIVSWLGYPGSLGHPRLADYIIGDPVVTPLEHAGHFSETLALLPQCYQPNDRNRKIGPRPTRREEGLPDTGLVFCSFNQSYKLSPEVFDIWCRLLGNIESSVLWLLKPSAPAVENLRREAAKRRIAPDRLIFAERKSLADHLGRLQLADLALDTFPCGSHTTASDALWAAVPLLTRMGETFASRVGASLLHAVGLPELVTANWDEYLSRGLSLASDPGRLAGLKDKLANRRSSAPLFDTEAYTRDLERLYQHIWQQHGEGRKETICLPALP